MFPASPIMLRVLERNQSRWIIGIVVVLAVITLLKVGVTLLDSILDVFQVGTLLLLVAVGGFLCWQRIRGR